MSLRWRDRRKELFSRAPSRDEASGARSEPKANEGKLRRDWSTPRRQSRRRLAWTPLFAAAVVSLLALAALRVSILRTRYALGATLQHETELLARERSVAVAASEERAPQKLREAAARRGFGRPERVIDLADEARAR